MEARYTHLKKLMAPDYILPLKTNPTWGLRDVFFTPGLHLVGDKLAFDLMIKNGQPQATNLRWHEDLQTTQLQRREQR